MSRIKKAFAGITMLIAAATLTLSTPARAQTPPDLKGTKLVIAYQDPAFLR